MLGRAHLRRIDSERMSWVVAVALMLSTAACGANAEPDAPVGLQVVEPSDDYVDVDGVRLHYRDYGGSGDLLVFVPGFFMTAHVYDRLAPYFTDRYRVLALTWRGHGLSGPAGADFDLDTLARDVEGFISHFSREPATVVGWVSAGLVLPRLARQRPDRIRALVLANGVWAAVPFPPGVPRWVPGATEPDTVYPSLEAAAEHLQGSMSITSTEVAIGVLGGNLGRRSDGLYSWLPPFGTQAEARFLAWYDSTSTYDGVDVPVLAIQVKAADALAADYEARGLPRDTTDLAVRWYREYYHVSLDRGSEGLRSAVPDAEVLVLDDLNHNYMIENPEVVAPLIRRFLERVASQSD